MNHNRIKSDFQNLPLPPPNKQRIKQTINLAQSEFQHFHHKTELSFFAFLRLQIRFISYKLWLIQLILLCIFIFIINSIDISDSDYQPLFSLLAILAPIVGMCGFSEFTKSLSHGMAEVESVTTFSLVRLTIARSIIISVMDLFCLTIIILASSLASGLTITSFIVYLLVPFLFTLCACLAILNKMHYQHDNAICTGVSVLCSLLFFALSFVENAYTATSISAWIIILIGTIFYGIYEFTQTIKLLKGGILWDN